MREGGREKERKERVGGREREEREREREERDSEGGREGGERETEKEIGLTTKPYASLMYNYLHVPGRFPTDTLNNISICASARLLIVATIIRIAQEKGGGAMTVAPSCSPVIQNKFFSIKQIAPYMMYVLNSSSFQYFEILWSEFSKNTDKSVYLEALL